MQSAVAVKDRGLMLARLLILAAVFAMGGFLWVACAHGLPVGIRALASAGALICFALPVRVLYVAFRRYNRTGSWAISQEERAAWRDRLAAHPTQPWVLPVYTAALIVFALVSTVSAAIRIHRHGPVATDVLFFVMWLLFLAVQSKHLFRQLRKTS